MKSAPKILEIPLAGALRILDGLGGVGSCVAALSVGRHVISLVVGGCVVRRLPAALIGWHVASAGLTR